MAVALGTRAAHAYPWMIRHGFAECGSCHVDPMGGETLTQMGRTLGEALLRTPWTSDAARGSEFLFGVGEPDDVRLGGSVRVLGLTDVETKRRRVFPMQSDLTAAAFIGKLTLAGSLGVSRASPRYEHSSKARLAGNAQSEDFIVVSRNHWLGYRPSDAWLLRLGRLNLPFGVRTSEHTLWVRSETLTDRESDQQHGLAAYYSSGPLRAELMAVLGNFQRPDDRLRERGYVGQVELLTEPKLAVGASSLLLFARRDPEVDEGSVLRQAHGITLRYSPAPPAVILLEGDVLSKTGSSLGYAGMATLDVEPLRGLHLGATGEVIDRGKPPSGVGLGRGRPHFGGWFTLDWFFAPHLELRVDIVARESRDAQLLTQLHLSL
ncbi:MAG TPA: hypothetical protein VMG12_36590 [Polyangiaceae bacterium]|nr:hypothetical protein [Polyangiaceae bacterium]